MRPKTLDEYIGQKHLVGEGAILRQMIESGNIASFILWGPPGVGKTTLARIIAHQLQRPFYTLSAVTSGVKEVRDVIDKAKRNASLNSGLFAPTDGRSPILFIDEIHRFSKSQQDSLLGAVEEGTITLVGATTENPSFEVITPLLSRCQVYVLKSLDKEDLLELLNRVLTKDEYIRSLGLQIKDTDALLRYIRAAFGMDPYALIMHYALYGRFEGRIANRLIATEEVVVPSGDDSVSVIDINKHDNGGMSAKQEQIARSKASQIATEIKKAAANYTPKKGTGVEVLECAYAAGIVQAYCNDGTYTTSGKNYRTAYGVFVAREYSSEGATRALGLILDYLGIRWEHANIGTYADQWCRVIVDGQEGFADGINGVAGYGKSSLEGGDGKEISYADVRAMFSVY